LPSRIAAWERSGHHPGMNNPLLSIGRRAGALTLGLMLGLSALTQAQAQTQPPAVTGANPLALQPIPAVDVAGYMGRWYQLALYPNYFQKQCVADTSATYRDRGDGTVEVRNRCRRADGAMDEALGMARPVAGVSRIESGRLQPARLEVSFLPAWLRWTGIGWGAYWVLDRANDGRYVIIGEGSREYLWVLARSPALPDADWAAVRARLQALGYDLSRLQLHPQTQPER
jgi:apolipoprotein D and lipocalin family protein